MRILAALFSLVLAEEDKTGQFWVLTGSFHKNFFRWPGKSTKIRKSAEPMAKWATHSLPAISTAKCVQTRADAKVWRWGKDKRSLQSVIEGE